MDTNRHHTDCQSGLIIFCTVLLALFSAFFVQDDAIATDHPTRFHFATSVNPVDFTHVPPIQFNAGKASVFEPQLKNRSDERAEIHFLSVESSSLFNSDRDTIPHPRDVMFRSLILPGWGQYTNRQAWKIPLVYGLIGGIAYYTYYADNRYRGFRAAFYNSFSENTDSRFGPTPSWIDPNASPEFYRESRNFFRNRRDFLIIATVLSYGLNVLDAYVFAHMRDFDVSDDLSARRIEVGSSAFTAASDTVPVPMLSLNLRF